MSIWRMSGGYVLLQQLKPSWNRPREKLMELLNAVSPPYNGGPLNGPPGRDIHSRSSKLLAHPPSSWR
jgi:hypothetical protein